MNNTRCRMQLIGLFMILATHVPCFGTGGDNEVAGVGQDEAQEHLVWLLSHDKVPKSEKLFTAEVLQCVRLGASPNVSASCAYGEAEKATVLHRAAMWGFAQTVGALVEAGVQVDGRRYKRSFDYCNTPLHCVLGGCEKIGGVGSAAYRAVVEELLRRGAMVATNALAHFFFQGKSLDRFVDEDLAAVVRLLVGCGAQVDVASVYGETPLWALCWHKYPFQKTCCALLTLGANPHALGRGGRYGNDKSCLQLALEAGHGEVVSVMVPIDKAIEKEFFGSLKKKSHEAFVSSFCAYECASGEWTEANEQYFRNLLLFIRCEITRGKMDIAGKLAFKAIEELSKLGSDAEQLRAKLAQKAVEDREAEIRAGVEKKKIEWGSQIRSYVLHPYKMVKDHRTSHESPQPDLILDGKLMNFIEAYLIQESGQA